MHVHAIGVHLGDARLLQVQQQIVQPVGLAGLQPAPGPPEAEVEAVPDGPRRPEHGLHLLRGGEGLLGGDSAEGGLRRTPPGGGWPRRGGGGRAGDGQGRSQHGPAVDPHILPGSDQKRNRTPAV